MASVEIENPPIDLRSRYDLAWDEALSPHGHDSAHKETYADWWARTSLSLAHLEPRIAEQWIYRHFQNSPFCHLPLDRLAWRLEMWPGETLVDRIRWLNKDRDDPRADYQAHQTLSREREPRLTFDASGTWNIPVLAIESLGGFITVRGFIPGPAIHLIEGHRRMRYLRSLFVHGDPMREHEIFILTLR
jgi:hypothetical protein